MRKRFRTTVGDLKKSLEGVSDDVPVLVPGFDHSYNQSDGGGLTQVVHLPESNQFDEYWDDLDLVELYGDIDDVATVIDAFVIN